MGLQQGSGRAALWIALVASVAIIAWILLRLVQSFYPTARFLVPVSDIPPFTELNAAHFTEVVLPEAAAAAFPDALRPGDKVTGLVTRTQLPQGMLVSKRSLGEQGDGSLATLLAPDATSRIVSFTIPAALALGGRIQPGERIDLYVWYNEAVYLVAPRLLVLSVQSTGRDESLLAVNVEVGEKYLERVVWAAAASQGPALLVASVPGAKAPDAVNIPFDATRLPLAPGEKAAPEGEEADAPAGIGWTGTGAPTGGSSGTAAPAPVWDVESTPDTWGMPDELGQP